MVDPTGILQYVANGVVIGAILTLTAVGLTLVYGILNLANFAHGDLITTGAYMGLFFTVLIPRTELLGWALALVAILALLVIYDRFLRRPLTATLGRAAGRPMLSRGEELGVLYLGLGTLALLASVLVPADVPLTWAAGATVLLALVGVVVGILRARRGPSSTLADPVARGLVALAGLVLAYLAGSGFLLGVFLSLILVGGFSIALDILVWRPMRGQNAGLLTLIIISIGVALALRNLLIFQFSGDIQSYPGLASRAQPLFGGLFALTVDQQLAIAVAAVVILAVHVLLRYTRMGKAMRALSDNMELARIAGIDVDRVILYVWLISGALAALSGVLLAIIRPFDTNLGWFLLLPIFASVILGGIGSPYGAMVGAMIIGIAQEASPYFGVPSSYRIAVGFAILIIGLIVRPQGILGKEAVR